MICVISSFLSVILTLNPYRTYPYRKRNLNLPIIKYTTNMSNSSFSPKDIIAAKAKCGDAPWFKLDPTNTRKVGKQNLTYYIPFTARNLTGKYIPLNVSFGRQVIASSAKPPHGVTDEEAKDVRILFRELERDDFEPTEYNKSKIDGLLTSNKEFITALNIIADEYLALAENEVLTYKGDKFKLNKVKTINCFRQTHRNAGEGDTADEEGKVPLPKPLFRLKVPADPNTKKLGNPPNDKMDHRYIVFDMSKNANKVGADGKTRYEPVVAKLKTSSGKFLDLTVSNAKNFITYMSLTGGKVTFDSICISKAGLSLMCKIRDLHVMKHKQLKSELLDSDTVNDMNEYGAGLNTEDEVFDEPTEEDNESPKETKSFTKKPAAKTKLNHKSLLKALDNDEDEVTVGNDEPEENEVDEDEKPANSKQEDATEEHDEDEHNESVEEPVQVKKSKLPAKGKLSTGGNLKAGARAKKDT